MMVKPAPRFATILCRWLGRLAMPIGEALSAAGGAIVEDAVCRRRVYSKEHSSKHEAAADSRSRE